MQLNKAQVKLRQPLLREEQFWSQKTGIKWFQSGDHNSKFFYAVIKQRRVQGMIHRIKNSNGIWVDADDDIASEAIRYFSYLFSDPTGSSSELLHLILPIVTGEESRLLEEVPCMEEVRWVVFAMDGDSAVGPNGFTGMFYTFVWNIIAQDVYNAVLSFFVGQSYLVL